MGCAHEAWEKDTAAGADALCPLCLRSMLDLTERRLADSERLRTGLATALATERDASATIAESFAKEYGPDVGKMAKRIAEVIRRKPLAHGQ